MKAKGSAYWMSHIEAIERETISTNAYAKRHGIAVKRLYYWQRKKKSAALAVTAAPNQAKKFIALRVAETGYAPINVPATAQTPVCCTLILGTGLRLEMTDLPAPTWLAALGRAAQGER